MTTTAASSDPAAPSPHQAQLHFSVDDDAPRLQPTVLATPEQVEFFHHNGFVSIPNLASAEEMTALRLQYDDWFSTQRGFADGNFFDLVGDDSDPCNMTTPQMLWPSRYGFDLYGTVFYANAYAISKQLLGPDTTFKGDHAICKPVSATSVPTPWHQDEAYWSEQIAYEALGVWLALQPVSLSMGCMQFLPQSHRLSSSPLPHQSIDKRSSVHGLELTDAQLIRTAADYSVSVPLGCGGATFHHCRTLHYTGRNASQSVRRAYTLSFQGAARQLSDDERRDYHWNRTKQTQREKRQQASGWQGREP